MFDRKIYYFCSEEFSYVTEEVQRAHSYIDIEGQLMLFHSINNNKGGCLLKENSQVCLW